MFVPMMKSNYNIFGMSSYGKKPLPFSAHLANSKNQNILYTPVGKNNNTPEKGPGPSFSIGEVCNHIKIPRGIQKRVHGGRYASVSTRFTYSNPLPVIYEDRCLTREDIMESYQHNNTSAAQTSSKRYNKIARHNESVNARTFSPMNKYNIIAPLSPLRNKRIGCDASTKQIQEAICHNSSKAPSHPSPANSNQRVFLKLTWPQKKKASGNENALNTTCTPALTSKRSSSLPSTQRAKMNPETYTSTPSRHSIPKRALLSYSSHKSALSNKSNGDRNKFKRSFSKLLKISTPSKSLSSSSTTHPSSASFLKKSICSEDESLALACKTRKSAAKVAKSCSSAPKVSLDDLSLPSSSSSSPSLFKRSNSLHTTTSFRKDKDANRSLSLPNSEMNSSNKIKKQCLKMWKWLK